MPAPAGRALIVLPRTLGTAAVTAAFCILAIAQSSIQFALRVWDGGFFSQGVFNLQVENRVVGAPCGVMDQMAAALGRRRRLLALACTPAQLQPPVALPPNLRLWGVDSGAATRSPFPLPMNMPCHGEPCI